MGWRVTLIVLLGLMNIYLFSRVVWGPTGIMEYRNLKGQLLSLREDVGRLDAENRALSRDIRLLQSDGQYVEKLVRQRLHYMRDNEIVYIFTDTLNDRSEATPNDGKN